MKSAMKKSFEPVKFCALAMVVTLLAFHAEVAQQTSVDYSHKFNQFYGAGWENAMAHLDAFALSLNNSPNELGVVIVYGGNHGRRGEAKAWSACVKDYLVNRRSIDASKLIMIEGGYRRSLTVELWGAADPKHVPTASPEISAKHVKFKSGRMRPWRRMCNL
jgi:hypothetical protein